METVEATTIPGNKPMELQIIRKMCAFVHSPELRDREGRRLVGLVLPFPIGKSHACMVIDNDTGLTLLAYDRTVPNMREGVEEVTLMLSLVAEDETEEKQDG